MCSKYSDRILWLTLYIARSYLQLTRCHAIAGSTARCGCKFRYISKFSAALGGFHCDNNAFELNNSINCGKIRVFNIIYLLPLIHAEIVHSRLRRHVSLQLQDSRRRVADPFLNFTCGPSADPTLADAEFKFPHTTHHTPLATLNSKGQPAASHISCYGS